MHEAKKSDKIAKSAKLAVEKWREYFKFNIDQYHRMHEFVLGQQWEDDESEMLKSFKKVPLQFNKLATLVNTLLGEQQQNTPQLEIVPLSDCDAETASIRQIIVKDIMLSNDAKTVYQVAAAQSYVGGFGAFVIGTEYLHDKSFEQDITYHYLKDSTKAYWDVGAEKIDKTDGMHAGFISRMTRKKFKQMYGKKIEKDVLKSYGVRQGEDEIALSVQPTNSGFDNDQFSWADNDGVTIIDHYARKYTPDTLYKLSNGRVIDEKQMKELVESSRKFRKQKREEDFELGLIAGFDQAGGGQMMQAQAQAQMMQAQGQMIQSEDETIQSEDENIQSEDENIMTLYDEGKLVRIEDQRQSKRSKIMHYKIAGDYVLEKSEFPSEDLPIIFMDQNCYYDKNGKQVCRPFVIDALDAQRYLNYLGTQSAFILKISRYDQFIGSKKNVQALDTQQVWKDPGAVQGMLAYDESPTGAKPEQIRPPELSQSLTTQYQRAIEDMYTSTGLYPTRLGQQGNEVSGAAIDARTRQGSYTTYVAFNSVNRAITAGGKITNQMISRVYDTERVMNLMTPDEGRKVIKVNEQLDEYGAKIKNDLSKGTFEVRLQAGPSYEGQKAQALESLNMILSANPQLLNLIADLYAENLPLTNTTEIKNRLKTIVPAEILQAGKTGQMPKETQRPSPQDQAAMAEIQFKKEQIEIEKKKLEIKTAEYEAKTHQTLLMLQGKELELATQLEEAKLRYLAETDRTRSDNAISHADNMTKILINKMGETSGQL